MYIYSNLWVIKFDNSVIFILQGTNVFEVPIVQIDTPECLNLKNVNLKSCKNTGNNKFDQKIFTISGVMGKGSEMTIQRTFSVHGGVVKDPEYE